MKFILPFTYSWLIKKKIDSDEIKTILELGCGTGGFGDLVNDQDRYKITGIDIFEPYLKICRKKGKYVEVINKDLTKTLPFKDQSFDAVVCLQTIEHLKRENGMKLLEEMEEVAKDLVIISTPNGECTQEKYDSNKHQRHLSTWSTSDFLKRGYQVFGVGLKWVYGKHSCVNAQVELIKFPLYFFSFLMNPLANKFPDIACQMVAIKRK